MSDNDPLIVIGIGIAKNIKYFTMTMNKVQLSRCARAGDQPWFESGCGGCKCCSRGRSGAPGSSSPFGRTSGPTPSSPSRSPIPSAAAPPLRNEFLIGQTVECTSDVIEAYNGLRGVVCNINYEPNSGLCYDVSFQQNQHGHAVGAGAAGWQTTTTSQYNHDVDGAAGGGWPMSMPAAASRSDHLQPFGLVGVHGQVHEQVHVDGGPGNASASTSQRHSPYPPPWDVGSSCSMVGMSMPSAAVSPGGAPGGVSQAYSPHDQESSQHGRQLQNHNQNHDQHDLQASGFYNYDGSSFTYDQHGAAGVAPGQPHPTQYQAAPAVEIMDQHHVAPTMLQQQQQQQHDHHLNIHVDGYNSEKGNEGGMGDRFADLEWLFRTEGLRRIQYELKKRRSYNHKSRAGREKRSNAGGNYNYNGGNANARNHNNYERSGSTSAVSGKYNGYDGYHGTQHGNSSSSPRGGGYDDGSGGAFRGSSGAFPAGTGAVYTAFNNGLLRPDSSSH
eukprot:g138.t1